MNISLSAAPVQTKIIKFLQMKNIVTRITTLLLFFSFMLSPVMASEPAISPAAAPASATPADKEVKAAVKEFKRMPRKERKARIKEAKKMLKEYRAAKKAGLKDETDTVLLVILAILLPPLAVYLHQGEINGKFWLSLILTLLFWLPGVIYALLVIFGEA